MSDRSISETLIDAACLIAQGWTQGACAVDAKGMPVGPMLPEAVAWDLFGALQRACGNSPDRIGAVLQALRWIGSSRRRFGLVAMVDRRPRSAAVAIRYLRHAAAIIGRDEKPWPT